jgi:hypothetical protein
MKDVKLCARYENGEPCVYAAFQKMIDRMKGDVAERQSIGHTEQLVVAKIYDLSAAVLAEACRRRFKIKRADCGPTAEYKKKNLKVDVFILLNQLKEDGFITDEYKQTIFQALIDIKPDIEEMIKGSQAQGLI